MEDDTSDGKGPNKQQVEVEGNADEMQKGDKSGHFFVSGPETSNQNEKLKMYMDFKHRRNKKL